MSTGTASTIGVATATAVEPTGAAPGRAPGNGAIASAAAPTLSRQHRAAGGDNSRDHATVPNTDRLPGSPEAVFTRSGRRRSSPGGSFRPLSALATSPPGEALSSNEGPCSSPPPPPRLVQVGPPASLMSPPALRPPAMADSTGSKPPAGEARQAADANNTTPGVAIGDRLLNQGSSPHSPPPPLSATPGGVPPLLPSLSPSAANSPATVTLIVPPRGVVATAECVDADKRVADGGAVVSDGESDPAAGGGPLACEDAFFIAGSFSPPPPPPSPLPQQPTQGASVVSMQQSRTIEATATAQVAAEVSAAGPAAGAVAEDGPPAPPISGDATVALPFFMSSGVRLVTSGAPGADGAPTSLSPPPCADNVATAIAGGVPLPTQPSKRPSSATASALFLPVDGANSTAGSGDGRDPGARCISPPFVAVAVSPPSAGAGTGPPATVAQHPQGATFPASAATEGTPAPVPAAPSLFVVPPLSAVRRSLRHQRHNSSPSVLPRAAVTALEAATSAEGASLWRERAEASRRRWGAESSGEEGTDTAGNTPGGEASVTTGGEVNLARGGASSGVGPPARRCSEGSEIDESGEEHEGEVLAASSVAPAAGGAKSPAAAAVHHHQRSGGGGRHVNRAGTSPVLPTLPGSPRARSLFSTPLSEVCVIVQARSTV